jgi:DNA invertase Pin-like site-specific DNA recombinase
MSLRLDGYVRVSRVGGREGEGYISPSVQREAISNYAAELDGEIVAWHQDEDYSGGNVKRPDFQATLERLRDGASDGIVVMAIDRFARSVADGAGVVREITERGQVFASCQERIDPRTDEGQYMLNTFLNNAELFLNQSKTKWRTSKARAVARGAQADEADPHPPRRLEGPRRADRIRSTCQASDLRPGDHRPVRARLEWV